MDIHRTFGPGLLEIVYKDALEYEFKINEIPFSRESKFDVHYKDIILAHHFYADFVAYGDLILEIKAVSEINKNHIKQTLNYISIANSNLGLVLNFGGQSFQHKRIIN